MLADSNCIDIVKFLEFNELIRELGPAVFTSIAKDLKRQNYHGPLRLWQRFFKENTSEDHSASLLLPENENDNEPTQKKVHQLKSG